MCLVLQGVPGPARSSCVAALQLNLKLRLQFSYKQGPLRQCLWGVHGASQQESKLRWGCLHNSQAMDVA